MLQSILDGMNTHQKLTPEQSAYLGTLLNWQLDGSAIGAPPVGQVVTGTQIPLDAAYILNLAAANNLTARGQDITQQGQELNFASNQGNQAVTARGQDIEWQQALLQAQQQAQQIAAQFYIDSEQLGVDKASLNYQQRLGQVQSFLTAASQAAQQRQARANTQLAAIGALADRNGPQDWPQYARYLAGLGKVTGQTAQVDPTKIADGLVDPWAEAGALGSPADMLSGLFQQYNGTGNAPPSGIGTMPNVASPAPYQPLQMPQLTPVRDFNSSGVQSGADAGQGIGTAAGGPLTLSGPQLPYTPDGSASNPYVPQATLSPGAADTLRNDPNAWYSGVPNSAVSGLQPGQWQFVTTGPAGPSKVSDYGGFNVYLGSNKNSQLAPDYSINAGTPVWLQKLAAGGFINDPAAIVGEGATATKKRGAKALGNTGEILLNPTGAPIGVLSNDESRAMLAKDVTPKKGKRMPKAAKGTMKLRGYASGSDVYTGINPNYLEYTTYTPDQLGSQPFIRQLAGQMPTSSFRGFGAKISAPDLGVSDFSPYLNLQTYNAFDPTAQQMTQGLYGGLGLNFDDFYKQAVAAAPTSKQYTATRYGG